MSELRVSFDASAKIPTEYGEFDLILFGNTLDAKENLAFVLGNVRGGLDVPTRMHSECFTGDVLGSLRCDCGDQLTKALSIIGRAGRGVLLYLRQGGRGIGLRDKLRAYNLQDDGLDTVEANLRLGHLPDERDYRVAALMLAELGVRSVNLLTNNPTKISELTRLGMHVVRRTPIEIPARPENAGYLRTKAARMDHLLQLGKSFHFVEDQL